ncbi:MAG: hypothetical protein NWS20_04735 [Rickettsiaceae bacterium]|nr:hypothetical protein [Rickettsiaceae bacterium]
MKIDISGGAIFKNLKNSTTISALIILLGFITFYPAVSYSQNARTKEQDIYVSGYLKNLFENNYNISSNAFHVCNHVVVINNHKLDSNNPEDILNKTKISLQEIEYIKKVVLANSD